MHLRCLGAHFLTARSSPTCLLPLPTEAAPVLRAPMACLQTNDAAVAAAFHLPDTHFALDFVQPEQLTLRMLMRSLGGWSRA